MTPYMLQTLSNLVDTDIGGSMSVKLAKNPVPRKVWREVVKKLEEHGVTIYYAPFVILDEVGDEYATFASLYVKER
jgi:hypothetical protein